jgi:hypothetical protein
MDWPPLMIIGHWPPKNFRRRNPNISWINPVPIAQAPKTINASGTPFCKAMPTATVVMLLITAFTYCGVLDGLL